MNARNILVILAALAIAVASAAATWKLLEWRDRKADEACFAAPEPGCLLDAAERIAGRVGEDRRRAEGLLTVARGRGRTGDLAGMRRLLERATEAALEDAKVSEPDFSWPDKTLMARVVTAWEEAGDRERALGLANGPPDPLVRAGRREALVGFLVRQGDFEGALAVAAGDENSLATAKLLADIARARLAQGGDAGMDTVLERLGAIAAELSDAGGNLEVRSLIGQLQALAGRTEEALATAAALSHQPRRDWVIQNAVLERARNGDVEEALILANRIADPSEQVSVLWSVIDSLKDADIRDGAIRVLDRAEEIAGTILDPERRENNLSWIFDNRVELSDTDEALVLIGKVEDSEERDSLYSTRVHQTLESGDITEALEITQKISSRSDRRETFLRIAETAARVGNDDLARKVFKQVVADILSATEPYGYATELGSIAHSQIRAGFFDGARETIALIDDDSMSRGSAMSILAMTLARRGDLDAALQAFGAMDEDHYEREGTLLQVSLLAAQTGNIAAAVEIALRQDDGGMVYLLTQIASPEKIESSRPWRRDGIWYSESPPTPEWPDGWDDCEAAPTDECVLSLLQEMADESWYPYVRASYHMAAASGWADIGRQDKARAAMVLAENLLLQQLRDGGGQYGLGGDGGKIWMDLVKGWAKIGDWAHVEELANGTLKSLQWRLRSIISELYLEAGNLEAALGWALKDRISGTSCSSLFPIGRAYHEAGDEAATAEITALLSDAAEVAATKDMRRSCLANIARLKARAGMDEAAMEIAMDLDRDDNWNSLIIDIAKSQTRNGDVISARRTLETIEDSRRRIAGYRQLAKIAAKAGDNEQAENLAAEAFARSRAMPAGRERDRAFFENAIFLAENGDYDAARDFQSSIEDLGSRASSYREIAVSLGFAGEQDKAARAFRQAIDLAWKIPDTKSREYILRIIAWQQAGAGLIGEAMETAASVNAEESVQRQFVLQMGRRGDMTWAMQTMRGMEFDDAAYLLSGIVISKSY